MVSLSVFSAVTTDDDDDGKNIDLTVTASGPTKVLTARGTGVENNDGSDMNEKQLNEQLGHLHKVIARLDKSIEKHKDRQVGTSLV